MAWGGVEVERVSEMIETKMVPEIARSGRLASESGGADTRPTTGKPRMERAFLRGNGALFMAVCVRAAAVVAVSAGLAIGAGREAAGQTAFVWAAPVDGAWSDGTKWLPIGTPGATSNLDTATLGTGSYTVSIGVNRTIASLQIAGSNARVRILPTGQLTIRQSIFGAGRVVVGDGASANNCYLDLGSDVLLATSVRLDGVNPDDAQIRGVGGAANPARIGVGTVVSGTGQLNGSMLLEGTVSPGLGGRIEIVPSSGVVTGGGEVREDGGRMIWSGRRYEQITLGGAISVDPTETLVIGQGVVVSNPPLVVSDGVAATNSFLDLAADVTLGFDVTLNGSNPDDAQLRGVGGAANPARIGAGTTVRGTGQISGSILIEGTVSPGPGGRLSIEPASGVVTGGGEVREDGGRVIWSGRRYEQITLGGAISVDPTETLVIGQGVVVSDPPLVVSDGVAATNSFLDLAADVTLGFDVTLNGSNPDDAQLRGVGGAANPARIGGSVVVSGTGEINNAVSEMAGELSPGTALVPGRIVTSTSVPMVMTNAAVCSFDLGGTGVGQFDRITNSGTLVLGGDIEIRELPGYVPQVGDTFRIVSGGTISGFYDFVGRLSSTSGAVYRLAYGTNTVDLVVTCLQDLNADILVDFGDVADFLAAFNAGSLAADLNADGLLDFGDVGLFASLFTAPCE
jgi:hypothetical protein